MKNLKLIGLFMFVVSVFACGGDPKPNSTEEDTTETVTEVTPEVDMKGLEMVDLSDYDVFATIYAPDESTSKRMITATEWGGVRLESGSKYGIEITPSGISVAEKKEELSNASVYTIEITSETSDKLVYTKSITGTELEPEVHFFMTVDIDGEIYSIASLDNAYNKKAVEKMMNSAQTLAAK